MHISETDQLQQSTTSPTPISPVHKVEALICSQSWLQTSQRKLSEREAAEEVQADEEIREGIVFAIEEKCRLMCVKLLITPFLFLYIEFVSKDCTDKQHHVGMSLSQLAKGLNSSHYSLSNSTACMSLPLFNSCCIRD